MKKWLLLGIILLPLAARAQQVDSLIASLADRDPQKRAEAEKQLAVIGPTARPSLVEACRSENPAIASSAARLLLSMPWHRNNDPFEVQQRLSGYGTEDEAGRMQVISDLAQLPDQVGVPALLRLIVEDPSEDVCWKIISVLTPPDKNGNDDASIRDFKTREQARQLQPPDTRPAALVLAGRAWLWKDHAKGLDFLRRAIQAESRHQTYDDNELDFAYDAVAEAAAANGRYDEAAQLRRQQAGRIGMTGAKYPGPIYDLFVLHGRFGPLAGFDEDVRDFADELGHPQVLYALSRAYARSGRMLESMAAEQAAYCSSLTPDSRKMAAALTTSAGWYNFARQEAYCLANMNDPTLTPDQVRGRMELASLAARDENDVDAVDHYNFLTMIFSDAAAQEAFAAEAAWHSARLAQTRLDAPAMLSQLDKLAAMNATETDVVENSYPLFIAAARSADAERIFNTAYAQAKARLALDPENPESLNNLAWMCARCDQKLPEALNMSQRAVTSAPDQASFIDTLAEVNFRMGNAAEAAKLETRALSIEPDDAFMTKQLARFKAQMTKSQ